MVVASLDDRTLVNLCGCSDIRALYRSRRIAPLAHLPPPRIQAGPDHRQRPAEPFGTVTPLRTRPIHPPTRAVGRGSLTADLGDCCYPVGMADITPLAPLVTGMVVTQYGAMMATSVPRWPVGSGVVLHWFGPLILVLGGKLTSAYGMLSNDGHSGPR